MLTLCSQCVFNKGWRVNQNSLLYTSYRVSVKVQSYEIARLPTRNYLKFSQLNHIKSSSIFEVWGRKVGEQLNNSKTINIVGCILLFKVTFLKITNTLIVEIFQLETVKVVNITVNNITINFKLQITYVNSTHVC